jgi:hypothetical protein
VNVALTRARRVVVVTAAVEYLARVGGPVVRRLLDRLVATGVSVDAADFFD